MQEEAAWLPISIKMLKVVLPFKQPPIQPRPGKIGASKLLTNNLSNETMGTICLDVVKSCRSC